MRSNTAPENLQWCGERPAISCQGPEITHRCRCLPVVPPLASDVPHTQALSESESTNVQKDLLRRSKTQVSSGKDTSYLINNKMQTSSTSRIELRPTKSPDVGGSSLSSARDVRKSLSRYSLLLAPGLLGGLFPYVVYPPLDQGLLVTFALCVLFLPMALQLRSIVRRRLSEDAGRLRSAYVYSSLALAVLALLLILNGWLDRSPRSVVRTAVIEKKAVRGKGGTRYVLTVSSWRPGRRTEDFRVSSYEFNRSVVGKTVAVELHKGFFNLPWFGNISPE